LPREIAAGTRTPIETAELARMVEAHGYVLELGEMEARLRALEAPASGYNQCIL
jgi:hypothetical protein